MIIDTISSYYGFKEQVDFIFANGVMIFWGIFLIKLQEELLNTTTK